MAQVLIILTFRGGLGPPTIIKFLPKNILARDIAMRIGNALALLYVVITLTAMKALTILNIHTVVNKVVQDNFYSITAMYCT